MGFSPRDTLPHHARPITAKEPDPQLQPTSRLRHFALFLLGVLWALVADRLADAASMGITGHFGQSNFQPLLKQVLFLFLLAIGFTTLSRLTLSFRGIRAAFGLPKRPTGRQEWGRGFALGWAMVLLAVLPMVLTGSLHPEFWLATRAWGLALLSLATLALGMLAVEVVFRGFLFQRLLAAIGEVAATILLSLLYAAMAAFRPNATLFSTAASFALGLLLSIAYLRTRALWLGWGLHFAWNAVTAVVLGLPLAGDVTNTSPISTAVTGPVWLTGGACGPMGAAFTMVVVLLAIVPLFRITRDYAWNYTHPEILSAGIAVVIAPPAAHTAMEEAAAAKPAPLVQILSSTSAAPSTMPVIEEHLRSPRDPD